jgi:hypothetical protein
MFKMKQSLNKLTIQCSSKRHILHHKVVNSYTLYIPTYTHIQIQSEHKRTLHFQNNTENKCGILRTSHLHQSIEKLSKFCTHFTETQYVLCESHGRCRDDNPNLTQTLCRVSLVMEAMAVVICVNGYSAGWFHVKLCA